MKITVESEIFGEIRSITALESHTDYVGGRRTVYMLLEIEYVNKKEYGISVSEREETEIRTLPLSLEKCREMYELIRKSEVSLCTLNDVIDDMAIC